MRGSGGTEGGIGLFLGGFVLSAASLWFFFDSVLVTSGGIGLITGLLRGRDGAMTPWQTTSMGVIFLPFAIGVFALFYDSRKRWAWYLTYAGIFVLAVEILSRIQFVFNMKTSHLMIMLVAFAAGTAMMFRSYKQLPQLEDPTEGRDPAQRSESDKNQSKSTK